MKDSPEQRAKLSAALKDKSPDYPKAWKGKVPLKVTMLLTVKSDLPFLTNIRALKDQTYFVSVNRNGAVTALFDNGDELGIRPAEFEIVAWHE
jgi:hypothetical protein